MMISTGIITFIRHKYDVKHACKQCNVDRLNQTGMVAYLDVVPLHRT